MLTSPLLILRDELRDLFYVRAEGLDRFTHAPDQVLCCFYIITDIIL